MKVSQLPAYQSQYLKAADLAGHTARVTIERVEVRDFPKRDNPQQKDKLLVLFFAGKVKGLVLSIGRARSMVDLFGDESDNWSGKTIRIRPGKATNGKATILIEAAPEQPAAPATNGTAAAEELDQVFPREEIAPADYYANGY